MRNQGLRRLSTALPNPFGLVTGGRRRGTPNRVNTSSERVPFRACG
jgi:hypothetical protein